MVETSVILADYPVLCGYYTINSCALAHEFMVYKPFFEKVRKK